MKTLKKSFSTALFLIFNVLLFAQNLNDIKINFIKDQVSSINNEVPSYKKVLRNDGDQSTEGGEIKGYFKNKEIKKIMAVYYGETGKTSEEYYFFDKKLIFYYRFTQHYGKPFYVESKEIKIISKDEDRYYFDNGIIVKHLSKPIKHIVSDNLFKTASETQKDVKRLLTLLCHPALAE